MKKQICILALAVLLVSFASAEVIKISPESLGSLDMYSGESITQNITIETDGNYEVYLTHNITGNSFDMIGFDINYSESPIFVEKKKIIEIIISAKQNYKPDNFTINFQASTEKAEEDIEKEFN